MSYNDESGLEVNISVHLQSLISKPSSILANWGLGDRVDSNSQTFASGYFSHSQLSKSVAFCEFASVNFEPCQNVLFFSFSLLWNCYFQCFLGVFLRTCKYHYLELE